MLKARPVLNGTPCYPTQVNAPRLTPARRRVHDLPTRRDGRLSWPRLYPAMERPGGELATSRSHVRRPKHHTTEPPTYCGRRHYISDMLVRASRSIVNWKSWKVLDGFSPVTSTPAVIFVVIADRPGDTSCNIGKPCVSGRRHPGLECPARLRHVSGYLRIIPYCVELEDVSVFQDFLTLTTCVTLTL